MAMVSRVSVEHDYSWSPGGELGTRSSSEWTEGSRVAYLFVRLTSEVFHGIAVVNLLLLEQQKRADFQAVRGLELQVVVFQTVRSRDGYLCRIR
jgi:hypothetical protein